YHPDGRLDAAFGAGGKVTTDFGERSATANAVLVQADGKFVVVGNVVSTSNSLAAFAARYNPDGSLDATFGTGGRITITSLDSADAVALLPDGRLLVAGGNREDGRITLVRSEVNGGLDSRFGTGGRVTTPLTMVSPQGLLVRADGRIVLAGGGTARPG